MFERIVLHEPRHDTPAGALDLGFLAETMLFYGHTHVVVGRGSLNALVDAFGPETLIAYLREGHMTMTYTPNILGVATAGYEHSLNVIHAVGKSSLQDYAQLILQEKTGRPGRGRRLAMKLRDLVKEEWLPDTITARLQSEWLDKAHVARSVAWMIEAYAPKYVPPKDLLFEVRENSSGAALVDTNINFEQANAGLPHPILTPAYLLGQVTHAGRQVEIASEFDAEFATDALTARIVQGRVGQALARSVKAGSPEIATFEDVVLGDLPSLRDVINSRQRTFEELRPILERAKKFREWIAGKSPDANLVKAYHQDVTRESWIDQLPARPIRFALFAAAGLAVDAFVEGHLGKATGVALEAVDYFLLDKLVKGWRPNQFVDGPLKAFLRGRQ